MLHMKHSLAAVLTDVIVAPGCSECISWRRDTDAAEKRLEFDGPAASAGQHTLHFGEAADPNGVPVLHPTL